MGYYDPTQKRRSKRPRYWKILSVILVGLFFVLGVAYILRQTPLIPSFAQIVTTPAPNPPNPTTPSLTPSVKSAPDASPVASKPNTLVSALPAVFSATYDAQGNLESVLDKNGNPVTDQSILANFPPQQLSAPIVLSFENMAAGLARFNDLTAAVYDAENQQLVLVGKVDPNLPPLNLDDLMVAWQSVQEEDWPGVSIDPGNASDMMNVRYIGPTANTRLGRVMFEADRLMKVLSLGKDNITGRPVTSQVPGYKNELQLGFEFFEPSAQGLPTWHRFWFVKREMQIAVSADRRSMAFDQYGLQVNTEFMGANFKPVPGVPASPEAQAFADHLTNNYDAYAAEFPIFHQLLTMYKWVAVANWLQDNGIALDFSEALESVTPITTPEGTPAIAVSAENQQGNQIQTVSLFGGVDFRFKNDEIVKDTLDLKLGVEALKQQSDPLFSAWNFTHENMQRFATAIRGPGRVTGGFRVESSALPRLPTFSGGPELPLTLTLAQKPTRDISVGIALGLTRLAFPLRKRLYDGGIQLYPRILLVDPATGERVRFEGPQKDSVGRTLYVAPSGDERIEALPQDHFVWKLRDGRAREFDSTGRLIRESHPDATWISFQYEGDNPIRIQSSSGAVIRLTFDKQNRLTQASDSTRLILRVHYDDKDIRFFDGQGSSSGNLTLDDRGRAIVQRDGQGRVLVETVYDEFDRVLAQWTSAGYKTWIYSTGKSITTFRPPNPTDTAERLSLAQPQVQEWIRRFGGSSLDTLLEHRQLVQGKWSGHGQSNVILGDQVGDRALLLINDQWFSLSANDLSSPARLRVELERQNINLNEGPILIRGRTLQEMNFNEVFVGKTVVFAEGADVSQIRDNLAHLEQAPALNKDNTETIIALPQTAEEIQRVDVGGTPADWAKIAKAWTQMVRTKGYERDQSAETMNQRIERALTSGLNTIIVVAHSDGQKIWLPDGGPPFDLATLTPEARRQIAEKHPVVILLACETANVTEVNSFAKGLVDAGASAVLAPTSTINARTTATLLSKLYEHSEKEPKLLRALDKALADSELQKQLGTPGERLFRWIIGFNWKRQKPGVDS